MATKSEKLYHDSPSVKRDKEGKAKVMKPSQADKEDMGLEGHEAGGTQEMQVHGSSDDTEKLHQHERREVHQKHLKEHMDMHHRHEMEHTVHKGPKAELHAKHLEEHAAMHDRHEQELKEMLSRHEAHMGSSDAHGDGEHLQEGKE